MNSFVQRVMKATGNYTVMDFGCLKIMVLCAGILLGVSFPQFFLDYTILLYLIFILSFTWIMYRTFYKHMR